MRQAPKIPALRAADSAPTKPWQFSYCNACDTIATFAVTTNHGTECGVCYLAKQADGRVKTIPLTPKDVGPGFCDCPACQLRRAVSTMGLANYKPTLTQVAPPAGSREPNCARWEACVSPGTIPDEAGSAGLPACETPPSVPDMLSPVFRRDANTPGVLAIRDAFEDLEVDVLPPTVGDISLFLFALLDLATKESFDNLMDRIYRIYHWEDYEQDDGVADSVGPVGDASAVEEP